MTVTFCPTVTVPAVAAKVALVAPAETATVAGTVRLVLLLPSATAVLEGADWFRLTVQVLALPDDRLEGLHCREARASGVRVSEVVSELPPSVPVMTAVCAVVKVPAVAVKPAAVCPAVTVTDAGTVSAGSLDDKVTFAPDCGAGWLSINRHAVEPFTPRAPIAHCR